MTDCPICLCPLSSPWGSTSCGHPYHTACWELVVAAGKSKRGECAVCKSKVQYFANVFLDLDAVIQDDEEEERCDVDKELEALQQEWNEVYSELSDLLSSDGSAISGNSTTCSNSGASNDLQGTQDVRDICATIDLTQSPNKSNDDAKHDINRNLPEANKEQDQKQKKDRIEKLLPKLHQIHTTLMDLAPSNTKSQLKSKFISLRKQNISLESKIESLEAETTSLQSRLNNAYNDIFNNKQVIEREHRLRLQSEGEYILLLATHSKYQQQTQRQISQLKESNDQLKKKNDQLKNVSGLADVQEVGEMSEKYKKMSQKVHDVTSENRILKQRIEDMKRRRSEMDRIRENGKSLSREIDGDESMHDCKFDYDKDINHGNKLMKSTVSKAIHTLDSAPSRKSVSKFESNRSRSKHGHSAGNAKHLKRNLVRDISRWDEDDDDERNDLFDFNKQSRGNCLEHPSGRGRRNDENGEDGFSDEDSNFNSENSSTGNMSNRTDLQLLMQPRPSFRRSIKSSSGLSSHTGKLKSNSTASNALSFHHSSQRNVEINASSSFRNSSTISTSSVKAGTKRLLKDSATLSRKSLKNDGSSKTISSFFKPVAHG